MGTIAWVALGVVIICLVEYDILATVFHPERESPLSTRFQRGTWRVLKLVARVGGYNQGASPVLNWGLPIMIGGLIVLWLLLLILGFACIYYPWFSNENVFVTPNRLDATFLNTLYYSGVTIATLGYGDIQAGIWPFQMLSILQAILGALTSSFGVAYVLAVYPSLSRVRTLAAALDAEVAGQACALPLVRRYISEERTWQDALADRLRELAMEILAITENHETHPVLYYAHPRRVQHSFLRIMVTSQNLVGLLRYGLSPDQHGDIVHNPQLLLLEQSLHYGLRRLSASLHIPPIPEVNANAERQRLSEDFADICRSLEQIGFVSAQMLDSRPVPVLVDSGGEQEEENGSSSGNLYHRGEFEVFDPALDLSSNSPLDAYIAFRLQTDPLLDAYAYASGYALEDVRADYDTGWWTGGR